jgi:ubiquinone/menaquinone biosynthesis C-methylase UbiE
MDIKYLKRRQKSVFSKLKLQRRIREAIQLIEKNKTVEVPDILDIGACDGKMLSEIRKKLKVGKVVGIEPNNDFIEAKNDNNVQLVIGRAEKLPFPNEIFDIIIASSVIEHIEKPDLFFSEAYRVLKTNGILIIFFVVPFYEKLSIKMKIKKQDHYKNYLIDELKDILEGFFFKIAFFNKFSFPICSPFINFEILLENIAKKLKLDSFLFYQEAVVRKI